MAQNNQYYGGQEKGYAAQPPNYNYSGYQQQLPPPQPTYPAAYPQARESYRDPCLTATGAICSTIFGFLALVGFCCIQGPRRTSYIAGLAIGLPIAGALWIASFVYEYFFIKQASDILVAPVGYNRVYLTSLAKGVIDIVAGAIAAYVYFKQKKTYV
ncbi:hypothetical protein BJ742DRAFT_840674 [Cladochytrium replicatum]|nr:hypothetical protein BJ742DRAFT_840674 [Cladochytrium replicatum]